VSVQLASSPPFPLSGVTSPPTDVVTQPRHIMPPSTWSKEELAISALSSDNALSRRLLSQAETEALNPYHRRRPSSLYRPTPTLHCYKNVISILTTISTTQSRLHFSSSSITRTPHHRRSTHHRGSLSPISYTHRPSA
jgi:hypothetical protein